MSVISKLKHGTAALAVICCMASGAAAQTATTREYPTLYKSPRAMGMGGAYTAIGGRTDALFYNPAGLSTMPRDKGWEVNIINLSAEVNNNGKDFFQDLMDAFDTGDLNNNGKEDDDQLKATNDVLAKYRGESLHLRLQDLTSIGKGYDKWAFAVGAVGSGNFDAMAHQGFGSEGLLEINANATYGAVGGFSMVVSEGLTAGIGLKQLHREALNHNFTAQELVEKQNTLDDYITDTLRTEGDSFGFDAGVIWQFERESWWRPSAGLSLMNIGDLDFGAAGMIPMTVNAGFAVNPQITWSRSLVIGFDYVDILNNYEQDKDMMKRTRLGAELQLFDIMPVEMAIRAGLYQGNPTFGVDLRLLTFLFSYTMYSEEIGAYAGQDKDTRQMLTFNFGW